jgi:HPt (histidine-containing phosphotransfer) domain-containing protein
MKKERIDLSDLEAQYGSVESIKKFNDLHNKIEEIRQFVMNLHPNMSVDEQDELIRILFQSLYFTPEEKKAKKKDEVKPNRFTYTDDQGLKILTEQDMAEEIPIEEFENDTQDYYLKELMEKFPEEDKEIEDKPFKKRLPDNFGDGVELLKGSTALNDYHQQRSKAACLEVKEMSKRPFSLQQAKEQVQALKEGIQGKNRKFD